MATTAADRVLVDANIFVYSRIATAPLHAVAVTKLDDLTTGGAELWSSRQVLREFLSAVTRPQQFMQALPIADAVADVNTIQAHTTVADENDAVTRQLLLLLQSIPCGGKQVHDANIVATMLVHGVPNLLTHNTADFTRFGHLITVVPLVP